MQATITGKFTDSRQVAENWFSAFAAGDISRLTGLLSDDVVWHVDGDPGVSTVGLLQGREKIVAWLKSFPQNFHAREFVISHYYGDQENVLAIGRFRHTILSTGQTVGSDMVIRFTLRDHQICRYQIYEDSLLLQQAFTVQQQPVHQQIRLNGTVYRYLDIGEGPILLFAHGLFLDGQAFRAQYQALSQSYRCIVMDMPGHGQSSHSPSGWTLDTMTEDLALMIQEVLHRPVTFIGQSQGGMVGIRLAARFPELVERMVLIGTSAREEPEFKMTDWQLRREILQNGTQQQRSQLFDRIQQVLNSPRWLEQFPQQAADERQRMLHQDPQAMALALTEAVFSRGDIRSLLPDITMPVLVICGEDDPATPPELSMEIAHLLESGELALLPETGHHPMLESAAQVTSLIRQFLEGIPVQPESR
ncbi:alpha/beta fold hydrolase [Tatumella sp. UBA2305]|uniref:alpha/beta fold hydrolase n=1 Tax=Tatumella sp. UBA2305 TaxID=1947647 RepID=UPI0025CF886C|nr:alpha/beta fold hydrolase [Tatumella sp. UBA2305]